MVPYHNIVTEEPLRKNYHDIVPEEPLKNVK